jgi:uncharacterized Zn finger protein (UPF0148 family)
MSEDKKSGVFEVVCPCCQSVLWVDVVTRGIVKTEKHAARKKGSLDELLEKEQARRQTFDQKFEATAELEKQKKLKAREKFEKALTDKDLLKDDE